MHAARDGLGVRHAGDRRHPLPRHVITKVVDRDGQTIFESKPKGTQVLKPQVARATTDILKGVITQGTGSRADIGRPAAGKTGTSQLNRDLWFVGYTPQLVTAVWVGYPTETHGRWSTGPEASAGPSRRPSGPPSCSARWRASRRATSRRPTSPSTTPSKFDIPKSDQSSEDVVGSSLSSAKDTLGDSVSVTYVWSSKPKGTVVGQSTAKRADLPAGLQGPKALVEQSGGSSGGGGRWLGGRQPSGDARSGPR